MPAGELQAAHCLSGAEAGLECHRGVAGNPRPQWRDVQLSLRSCALYLAARARAQGWPRAVHPAADADQMRRGAAKGDVSVLGSLRRSGRLEQIDVQFFNAGAVLFGVADYVPALMEYIRRYDIALNFDFNLSAIDGSGKRATFRRTLENGSVESVTREFDMIHVVPPQKAPDFIRVSPLADKAAWIDVDQATLRHKTYSNVFALGDAANTPNAK